MSSQQDVFCQDLAAALTALFEAKQGLADAKRQFDAAGMKACEAESALAGIVGYCEDAIYLQVPGKNYVVRAETRELLSGDKLDCTLISLTQPLSLWEAAADE